MKTTIAVLLSAIFICIALLHIYWGFGGKRLSLSTVPTKENNKRVIKPGLIDCLAVALVFLSFAVFTLVKSGVILFVLPGWLSQYGLWIIASVFLSRAIGEFKYVGFFKKIKTSEFGQMDTRYYSPLCLLIGILVIILEIMT